MISILFFNWLHKKREHKTPVATGNCSSHRFHYRLDRLSHTDKRALGGNAVHERSSSFHRR
jgi:hypothetical protein